MSGETTATTTTETATCEYCHETHAESERVPVVGGEIVGEWEDPEYHIGVAPLGDGTTIQHWCPYRYEVEFGTQPDGAFRQRVEGVTQWITAKTAWAFVAGVVLTALAFLLFTPA